MLLEMTNATQAESFESTKPPTSETPALVVENLYRFFHAGGQETLALRGVTFTVNRGDVVAVTGPSGSGKSTLLACLAGLEEPHGGMVRVDGEVMSRRPETERAQLRAKYVGMLLQSNNLLDHLSVEDNVRLAQRLRRLHPRRHNESLLTPRELLGRLGLAKRVGAWPSELSGGESARAGLAVALANDPILILADEPTGELDPSTARVVLDVLVERATTGSAVVIVTHSSAVASIATRHIRLRDGQIDQSGGVR